MKHLWGLKAIANYVGWKDPRTPLRAMKREGFLMVRRRRGSFPKPVWYSNSGLVQSWLISKARADREMLLERERDKDGQDGAS